MGPIETARHQLARPRPVEHDCHFSPISRGLRQHVAGDGKRHQPAQDRGAVEAADDGAVAGNEDDRQIELLGNRACEREAAAGDEGDLDAAIERPGNGPSVLGGTFPCGRGGCRRCRWQGGGWQTNERLKMEQEGRRCLGRTVTCKPRAASCILHAGNAVHFPFHFSIFSFIFHFLCRVMQFTPKTLSFLRALKRHNEREWFRERKDQHEQHVRAPMIAVIEQLARDLPSFAPELIADAGARSTASIGTRASAKTSHR